MIERALIVEGDSITYVNFNAPMFLWVLAFPVWVFLSGPLFFGLPVLP